MTLELSVELVLAIVDDCAILMERREVFVEMVGLVIDTEDAVGIDRDMLRCFEIQGLLSTTIHEIECVLTRVEALKSSGGSF